jgi:predicted RNase H-related nuclease YkuK (DUF458 family)
MENEKPIDELVQKIEANNETLKSLIKKPSFYLKHQAKFITFLVLCFFGLIFYTWHKDAVEKEKTIKDLLERYSNEQALASQRQATIDSSMHIIKILSKYRGLTDAMYYRDSVRLPYKYNPGDFAYMKLDSSKVLVIDVIAGGDRNSYFVKYRVQDCKTRAIDEVSPDLIY